MDANYDMTDAKQGALVTKDGKLTDQAEIERLRVGIEAIREMAVQYKYAGIFTICQELLKRGE